MLTSWEGGVRVLSRKTVGSGVNVLRIALYQDVELRQTPLDHKAPGLSKKPGKLRGPKRAT